MVEPTLLPPDIPDVKSSDELETNISPDEKTDEDESKEKKQSRIKKNKMKLGCRNRAKQRKEA